MALPLAGGPPKRGGPRGAGSVPRRNQLPAPRHQYAPGRRSGTVTFQHLGPPEPPTVILSRLTAVIRVSLSLFKSIALPSSTAASPASLTRAAELAPVQG